MLAIQKIMHILSMQQQEVFGFFLLQKKQLSGLFPLNAIADASSV